ncbi:hypothetical protein PILCRDRAFT_694481 [Piloderma croceum F 1598]|uniref:Uncharacterized protein n=1 Tax=Piloderma croceum (strain F 1598) TaxID=765440 RepID=A0A0C3ALP7_PILCF|nr:hypothetical protein PILCRDRAFT_694481 [Piloderma croceum F 1598]
MVLPNASRTSYSIFLARLVALRSFIFDIVPLALVPPGSDRMTERLTRFIMFGWRWSVSGPFSLLDDDECLLSVCNDHRKHQQ